MLLEQLRYRKKKDDSFLDRKIHGLGGCSVRGRTANVYVVAARWRSLMEFQCPPSKVLVGRLPQRSLLLAVVSVMLLHLLAGCSSQQSRLHAESVPPGSLRLAQVAYIVPRAEILTSEFVVRSLQASGIGESDIHDGSITVGRVECCGGRNEKATAAIFYVPNDIKVEVGDIVEIRSGSAGNLETPNGPVNMLTRIREKHGDHDRQCRWDPPETNLWMRILYCEWMQAEGWTLEKDGFAKYWIKQSR